MKLLKTLQQGKYISAILLVLVFIVGFSQLSINYFDQIGIRKNPAITLPLGNTISNETAGFIDMRTSTVRVGNLLSDTSQTPLNVWHVSPGFKYNTFVKTAPTIAQALTGIDSGVIYVHPGIYTDRIVGKSRVSIIGESRDRVWIMRESDTAVVYLLNVINFSMKNLSIVSFAEGTRTGIRLWDCSDNAQSPPTIVFDNVYMSNYGTSHNGSQLVYANRSSFEILNSTLYTYNAGSSEGGIWNSMVIAGESYCGFENSKIIYYVTQADCVVMDLVGSDNMMNMVNSQIYTLIATNILSASSEAGGVIAVNNISNSTFTSAMTYKVNSGNVTDVNFLLR